MIWLWLLTSVFAVAPQVRAPMQSPDYSSSLLTHQLYPGYLAMSAGQVAGMGIVNKVGRNPDVDTGTVPEDVWNGGGAYTGFPATAETVQCFSSSAADTAAGTGARTLLVAGLLDANYNPLPSISVTLNGTTPVTISATPILRLHTARVTSAGSGGANAGDITCRHTVTTANVFFVMPIGYNQTNVSAYTVPAGKTAYITKLHGQIRGGAAAAAVDGNLWIRQFGEVFRSRRPFTIAFAGDFEDSITGGLVVTEKSDIVVRITLATNNNTEVVFGYDLALVDN